MNLVKRYSSTYYNSCLKTDLDLDLLMSLLGIFHPPNVAVVMATFNILTFNAPFNIFFPMDAKKTILFFTEVGYRDVI